MNVDDEPLEYGTVVRCECNDSPLEVGKVYRFVERTDGLVSAMCEARNVISTEIDSKNFLLHYDVCVEDGMILRELPELEKAMEVHHANTVIPLFTPNEPCGRFLMARTTADAASRQLFQLIADAEHISQESMLEAYINLTLQEPETSKEIFEEFFTESEETTGSIQTPEPHQNSELPLDKKDKIDKKSSLLRAFGGALVSWVSGVIRIYGANSVFDSWSGEDEYKVPEGVVFDRVPSKCGSIGYLQKYDTKALYDDFVKNCLEYGKMDQKPIDSPVFQKKKEELLNKLKFVMREAYSINGAYGDFVR